MTHYSIMLPCFTKILSFLKTSPIIFLLFESRYWLLSAGYDNKNYKEFLFKQYCFQVNSCFGWVPFAEVSRVIPTGVSSFWLFFPFIFFIIKFRNHWEVVSRQFLERSLRPKAKLALFCFGTHLNTCLRFSWRVAFSSIMITSAVSPKTMGIPNAERGAF